MSCRICSHPFRIRTNPQERGFDYVEGIKIQAGQEPSKELLENSFSTNMNIPDALEKLETAAQGKQKLLTELDQLKGLQKLNEQTKFNDADSNANIRARFRKDRKEKRARIREAKSLGWRDGMEVVGASSLDDQVLAKETVFGKSKETEKKRFLAVRQSSIFANDKTGKRKRRRKAEATNTTAVFPDFTASSTAAPLDVPSNPVAPNPHGAAVAVKSEGADLPATQSKSSETKTKRKINPAAIGKKTLEMHGPSTSPPKPSFSSMLSGYGSNSSLEED